MLIDLREKGVIHLNPDSGVARVHRYQNTHTDTHMMSIHTHTRALTHACTHENTRKHANTRICRHYTQRHARTRDEHSPNPMSTNSQAIGCHKLSILALTEAWKAMRTRQRHPDYTAHWLMSHDATMIISLTTSGKLG